MKKKQCYQLLKKFKKNLQVEVKERSAEDFLLEKNQKKMKNSKNELDQNKYKMKTTKKSHFLGVRKPHLAKPEKL